MNVNIVCVGRIKEKYLIEGIAEFAKRLRTFTKFDILEVKEYGKEQTIEQAMEKETEELISALGKLGGYHILLDLKGKERDSIFMAKHIESLQVQGCSRINFIIGGSDGYTDKLRAYCHEGLSFSRFTFPHQLMRFILVEQIYRWFSINHHIKYHK